MRSPLRRRGVALALTAAFLWGTMLAAGSFWKDWQRGAIVMGFVTLFALAWLLLLVRFWRRRGP